MYGNLGSSTTGQVGQVQHILNPPTPTDSRTGQLAESLGAVDLAIKGLEEHLGCLFAQLGPVLSPVPPSGQTASSRPQTAVEVIDIIDGLADRIRRQASEAMEIRRRLVV